MPNEKVAAKGAERPSVVAEATYQVDDVIRRFFRELDTVYRISLPGRNKTRRQRVHRAFKAFWNLVEPSVGLQILTVAANRPVRARESVEVPRRNDAPTAGDPARKPTYQQPSRATSGWYDNKRVRIPRVLNQSGKSGRHKRT